MSNSIKQYPHLSNLWIGLFSMSANIQLSNDAAIHVEIKRVITESYPESIKRLEASIYNILPAGIDYREILQAPEVEEEPVMQTN